jgi:diguanylate cyclase (GGDEF)-like protein/PAS domain S-box-containing protein
VGVYEAVQLLELGGFTALAAASSLRWARLRTGAAAWMTATFTVLAGAVLAGRFLPASAAGDAGYAALARAVVVLLGLFPYCLFRFGAAFGGTRRRTDVGARVATGMLLLATTALPGFPGDGEARPWWFVAYTAWFVLQWTVLSSLGVRGLWRAGSGQAAVVRRRMRMLGVAAVLLNAGLLLVAGGDLGTSGRVSLAGQLLGLVSAGLFVVGFAPPRSLRTVWRREEADRLRLAEADLMLADTTDAVAAIVLHQAAAMLGARSAVLADAGGAVVAAHGVDDEGARALVSRAGALHAARRVPASDVVAVAASDGLLVVQGNATTPIFGQDEVVILETLGHLTGLALDRADLVARDRAAQAELAEKEALLAEAQHTARLGSYRWDLVTGEVDWSDEMHRLLGFDAGEVRDHAAAFTSRIHPDDVEAVEAAWAASRRGDPPISMRLRIVLPGGDVRWIDAHTQLLTDEDGAPARLVGTMQDVTDRKLAEDAVAHQALHDGLTGLPNRRLFLDRLEHALAARARTSSGVAVLFIDVDRFKWLNDSLGHAAGDELLVEVARRLRASVRPGDSVARFGGDEFVVLCAELNGVPAAERLAARFAAELARPAEVAGEETMVTVSIGIAYSPPGCDADTPETLVRDADAAMYRAKDRGRDRFETFDAETRLLAVARHETANALRRGMDRGELVVYYQPQVDITTNQVVGVEALVRWRHPDRGLLPPSEFVPVAEETGLIVPLGVWVLTEACRQVCEWQPSDPWRHPIGLCVNLSARQLMAPDLHDVVAAALSSSGLEPSLLCLEITESVLLEDAVASARAMHRLKALGVDVGVDDFGTGFSSLTYLKRFPVDILKIDRSFVEGLGTSREDRAIVAGVVDLAHAFGLTAIAEGVETIDQLAELRAIGCEQGQGYLWSQPLSAADAERWIATHSVSPGPLRPRQLALVSSGTRPCRVLLVDDDRSVRALLRSLLESDGFQVVGEADDGRQAIALARHLEPDLVLLDLAMPGMGGLEALPLIQAVCPGAKVAVLSGLDAADVADSAASQGATAFFDKTDVPDLLAGLLRYVVST